MRILIVWLPIITKKWKYYPVGIASPYVPRVLRILENAVCENSSEIPVKHRNSAQFRLRMTIFRQIFTMSKNGRLKFQRFSRRLEKVRDCSTRAAPGRAQAGHCSATEQLLQHQAGRRQTTAAPPNNHCSTTAAHLGPVECHVNATRNDLAKKSKNNAK